MVTCTGHIGIHEGADVRTENDVMAILPNFLPSMGYQYFLSYGSPRTRAFGARGAPLIMILKCHELNEHFFLNIKYLILVINSSININSL